MTLPRIQTSILVLVAMLFVVLCLSVVYAYDQLSYAPMFKEEKNIPGHLLFSIVHITDTHLAAYGCIHELHLPLNECWAYITTVATLRIAEWAIRNKDRFRIVALIHTGDIVGFPHYVYDWVNWTKIKENLTKHHIKVIEAAGNHDIMYSVGPVNWYRYIGPLFRVVKIYSSRDPNWNVWVISLPWYKNMEKFGINETVVRKWIKEAEYALEHYPGKFILITHDPADLTSGYYRDLLCKYSGKIILALCGHGGRYHIYDVCGVPVIEGYDVEAPPHTCFNLIEFYDTGFIVVKTFCLAPQPFVAYPKARPYDIYVLHFPNEQYHFVDWNVFLVGNVTGGNVKVTQTGVPASFTYRVRLWYPRDRLVAEYTFYEDNASTIIHDTSGHGHNIKVSGDARVMYRPWGGVLFANYTRMYTYVANMPGSVALVYRVRAVQPIRSGIAHIGVSVYGSWPMGVKVNLDTRFYACNTTNCYLQALVPNVALPDELVFAAVRSGTYSFEVVNWQITGPITPNKIPAGLGGYYFGPIPVMPKSYGANIYLGNSLEAAYTPHLVYYAAVLNMTGVPLSKALHWARIFMERLQTLTITVPIAVNISSVNFTFPDNYSVALRIPESYGEAPTTMNIATGTLVSGSVSDLWSLDGRVVKIESYNDSNTMRIVVYLNVTGLDIYRSRLFNITYLQITIAGNLNKLVNDKASLEVYNWTSRQWVVVDNAALNQTTLTAKTYILPVNGIVNWSSGLIMLRINITDVQSYPSTYVYLTLDRLVVQPEAILLARTSLPIPENLSISKAVLSLDVSASGGVYRKVEVRIYNASGALLASYDNATGVITVELPTNIAKNITVLVIGHVLGNGGSVTVRDIKLSLTGIYNRQVWEWCSGALIYRGRLLTPERLCMLRLYLDNRYLVYTEDATLNITLPDTRCRVVDVRYGYYNGTPLSWTVSGNTLIIHVNDTVNRYFRTMFPLYSSYDYQVWKNRTIVVWLWCPPPRVKLDRFGRIVVNGWNTTIIVGAAPMYMLEPQVRLLSNTDTVRLILNGTRVVLAGGLVLINRSLYMWLNLSNPTIYLGNALYRDGRLIATVDLIGVGEINVYTLKLPTEVLVDGVHAMEVPDYLSYRACTPPCYWYDPVTHILHVKIRGHSPVTIVVDWTKLTQVTKHSEVRSVELTFNSTTVPVNRPVQYTVNVELYNAWSGVLTYTLTCTGPRTVSITGKITVADGRGTVTGYVTFSKAGTYACYVKVLDTYSPTVYVRVISHKAPFMAHIFTAYALLLLLVVAIVVIVIFIVEKKRRSGSGGEIVVRLNI